MRCPLPFLCLMKTCNAVFTSHGCYVDDGPSSTSTQLVHMLQSQVAHSDYTRLHKKTDMHTSLWSTVFALI